MPAIKGRESEVRSQESAFDCGTRSFSKEGTRRNLKGLSKEKRLSFKREWGAEAAKTFCIDMSRMSVKGVQNVQKREKPESIMLSGSLKCRGRVSKMAVWEGYALS